MNTSAQPQVVLQLVDAPREGIGITVVIFYDAPRNLIQAPAAYSTDADGFPTTASWLTPAAYLSVDSVSLETSLAVLGEPGVGKSTVIERLCAPRAEVHFVHMDEITSVTELENALADAAADADTGEIATLVLDGLDEWALPQRALVRRLGPLLDAHPKLQVVIGCRSANWSDSLSAALEAARPSFVAYELLPLSSTEVYDAAVLNGLDGDEFLTEVRGAGVVSLATRPLTLNLLLDLFAEDGRLPGTPSELFARGVTVLAAEHDPLRTRPQGNRGTSEQHRIVGSRLAACLAVSGQAALTFRSPAPQTDIDLATLAGGIERAAAGEFEVTPALVQDAIETALFVSRGRDRFVPMHASVASYLAACYLVNRQVPEHQLRAMLTRSTPPVDVGIPTQLHETAAWLLALDPETNGWIATVAPDALLTHAAYIRDDAIRAQLVNLLLSDRDLAIRLRWRTWRLLHSGLYEQLAPYMQAPLHQEAGSDFGHPVSAQAGTAIDIAVQSREVRAVDALVELALNSSLNPYLRARAAGGVLRLDPAVASCRLKPLLDEVVEHPKRDPDDELRGIALSACAQHLSAEKLIEGLRQPRQNRSLIGSYSMFISHVVEDCSQEQIRTLVQVTRADSSDARDVMLRDGQGRNRTPLLSRLLHRVFADLDLRIELWEDAVWLLAFCITSHASVLLPRDIIGGQEDDQRVRRDLALGVASVLPENRVAMLTRPVWFTDNVHDGDGHRAPLIGPDDFMWLCTEAVELPPERWIRLVKWSYDPDSPRHVKVLADLKESDGRFSWVGPWLEQLATQLEEDAEFESEPDWEGRSEHLQRLTATAKLVADGYVDACGDLVALLAVQPESGYLVNFTETDIGRWPGWAVVESSPVDLSLAGLADACAHFVARTAIPDGAWRTEAGTISHAVLQLAAMVELANKEAVVELAADSWPRLAPVIVRSPFDPMNDHNRRAAVKRLAVHAPTILRDETLRFLQDQYAAGWSSSAGLWMLDEVFDAITAASLTALVEQVATRIADVEPTLADMDPRPNTGTPEARRLAATQQELVGLRHWLESILETLLAHPGDHVADVATMLDGGTPTVVSVQAQTGVQLFRHRHWTWTQLWGRCEAEEELGREVVNVIAHRIDDDNQILAILAPDELGGLWRWLAQRWSPGSDRWESGFVTPEHRMQELRNAVARQLESHGGRDSLEVLSQLAHEYGDRALRDMAQRQTARLRDEHWEGTTPGQFFDLIADSSRVVVHDGDSLFRLVVSLLEGLARRLSDIGELLWNEIPRAKNTAKETAGSESAVRRSSIFRPKNEAQISLLIHDHLRDELGRGLVSNREVLVRPTNSKGAGLAVDVLVTAVDPEGGGREIFCPIEVKGNWNKNLLTDLRKQLVDDYMKDLHADYGVYVYAWFDVGLWSDEDDARLVKVKRLEAKTVAEKLQEAADDALQVGASVHVQRLDVPRAAPSARVET